MGRSNRGPTIVLGILALVIVVGAVLAGGMVGPGMMGPGMIWGYGRPDVGSPAANWGWGLSMAGGMLAMLAFWGALIVGIVLVIRWAMSQPVQRLRRPSCAAGTRPARSIRQPTSGWHGSSGPM